MRNLEAYADSRKQRLHIIDDVLEPLTPLVNDNSQAFIDLTAGKLLRESDAYRLPGHSIRYTRVIAAKEIRGAAATFKDCMFPISMTKIARLRLLQFAWYLSVSAELNVNVNSLSFF